MVQACLKLIIEILDDGMKKLTDSLSDPSLFFWFVHGTCNLDR